MSQFYDISIELKENYRTIAKNIKINNCQQFVVSVEMYLSGAQGCLLCVINSTLVFIAVICISNEGTEEY